MTDLSKDTSNCCGAKPVPETDLCSKCKEHAEFDQVDAQFLNVDDFERLWRAIT